MPLSKKHQRTIKTKEDFIAEKPFDFADNLSPYFICPFTLSVGITSSNEKGQAIKENLYQNYEQVFTGKDTIFATWDNSTIAFTENNQAYLGYKTGTYQIGYFDSKTYENEIAGSTEDTDFVAQRIEKTITLICENWDVQDSDFFKVYVIPSFIGDTTSTQAQLFIIESVEEVKDPANDKDNFHSIITFTSLNQKLSNSGSAITNFVQFAPPGSGYAFPKTFVTRSENDIARINIGLDEVLLENYGIDNFQIEFFGSGILNSVFLKGRTMEPLQTPTENNSDKLKTFQKYNILERPYRLHGYRVLPPIESEIKKIGTPESFYYWARGKIIAKGWWKNWREQLASGINSQYARQLTFEGVFDSIPYYQNILNSNQSNYRLWDNRWRINPTQRNIPTQPNLYTTDTITINQAKRVSDLLMLNSFINMKYEKLVIGADEIIPWSLREIPLIGGILGKLSLGIPIPWFNTIEVIGVPEITGLIPAVIYKYGAEGILNETNQQRGIIPMDLFRNNSIDDMNELLGTTATNMYYRATLSDVITTSYNQKVFTKYLGQKDQQNRKILINGSSRVYPTTKNKKFIVDFINFKFTGKCDFKITFYNGDSPVWTGKYKTRSKLSNSQTDWSNSIKFYEYPIDPNSNTVPLPPGIQPLQYSEPQANTLIPDIVPVSNTPLGPGTDSPSDIDRPEANPLNPPTDFNLPNVSASGYEDSNYQEITIEVQDFFPDKPTNTTWEDIYNEDFGQGTYYDIIELAVFYRHRAQPVWEYSDSYPIDRSNNKTIEFQLSQLIANPNQNVSITESSNTNIWTTFSVPADDNPRPCRRPPCVVFPGYTGWGGYVEWTGKTIFSAKLSTNKRVITLRVDCSIVIVRLDQRNYTLRTNDTTTVEGAIYALKLK